VTGVQTCALPIYGAHPLHPFPVFYENNFILNLASKIIFAGARSAEAAEVVGATAVATWEDAWRLAVRTVGKREPSVMVTPKVGLRTPLLWSVGARPRPAVEKRVEVGAAVA